MEYCAYRPLVSHLREGETPIASKYDLKRPRVRSRITGVACNACRVRKSACDGNRPVCTSCRRSKSPCIFLSIDQSETMAMVRKREHDTLRQRTAVMEELVEQMRITSDEVARSILQKLRELSDLTSVVDFFQENLPTYAETDTQPAQDPHGIESASESFYPRLSSLEYQDLGESGLTYSSNFLEVEGRAGSEWQYPFYYEPSDPDLLFDKMDRHTH